MLLVDQYRALREGAGLASRTSRGRLLLTGGDRRAYLQGLLTNDITALEPGRGCYAAYLTPQGRMIADMRVFETGESLLVDLDASLAAPVDDRWNAFVFSEDVQITDISVLTAQVGVYGPQAGDVLSRAFGASDVLSGQSPSSALLDSMPLFAVARWDVFGLPAFVLRSDDAGVMGFDVVIPADKQVDVERLLREAGAIEVGDDVVETARIEAGRPRFLVDMDESTIPLEAGIEGRAISLTKGCYVGQEIIIRVLHRGQGRVARRLVGLTFEPASAVPARGDRLRVGEREIGSITSAVQSPSLERPIALGYIHRDFAEPGTAVEAVHDGKALAARVVSLPFV